MDGGISNFRGGDASVVATEDFVYFGGSFSKTINETTQYNLLSWDVKNMQWLSVGEGGVGKESDIIHSLFLNDSLLFIGGEFKFTASDPSLYFFNLAAFNLASNRWDAIGRCDFAADSAVYSICNDPLSLFFLFSFFFFFLFFF